MKSSKRSTKIEAVKKTLTGVEQSKAYAERMLTLVTETERQLLFLAKHMSSSFDGVLDTEESNAYCALTTAMGKLIELEASIGSLGFAFENAAGVAS